MIVIGIDPATKTGWAYGRAGDHPFSGHSNLGALKGEIQETRLLRARALGLVIGRAARSLRVWTSEVPEPVVVAMEDSEGMTRGQAQVSLSHEIRGCIIEGILAAGKPFPRVFKIAPATLKVFATNYGKAEKDAMRAAIRLRFGHDTTNEDEIDALAAFWFVALKGPEGLEEWVQARTLNRMKDRAARKRKREIARAGESSPGSGGFGSG